ncbi:hypothetical protein PhCBS80983_g04643 [Powellomyces hirtus]|uniref:Aldehyde oxidase/xanthine dehydrogenase second molybdopterin binding domain-containing protein n=1 Tax=Powellomyces hirtus TaxID=109895 RepID=A0A507DYN2_9FUNG|nr:hypothetical protein PhCBS80983_g04643 [Powellomyces hirtus]
MESSDLARRKQEINEWNKKHTHRKRGISLMPTKFGLAFTARFLNQAGALVHIYTDGSVLITHGGTEMGQGRPAHENGSGRRSSPSPRYISPKPRPPPSPTLPPLPPPSSPISTAVDKAYFERTGLSATGFYKTPDLNFDWDKLKGRMLNYFTCVPPETTPRCERILRWTLDRRVRARNGLDNPRRARLQPQKWIPRFLITRGPGAYKIPGFRDIPVDFRVNFLAGVANMRAIHSSKAVGEPPLLGATIIYTIREAVKSARAQHGDKQEWFRMDSPATGERFLEACGGKDARKAKEFKDDGKAWGVAA